MTKHLSWLGLILLTPPLYAYQLSGNKWPSPQTTMTVDIVNTKGEATAPSGQSWNSAFEEAARLWNNRTGFKFQTQIDPGLRNVNVCQDDNLNSLQFRHDDCGFEFGATVLAITYSLFLRDGRLLEADIAVNDNEPWDIYSGKVRPEASDFRRVAAHELGHVMGLEHEDNIPSLMDSFIEDTEIPLKDDIHGVSFIYGLPVQTPQACQQITPMSLNTIVAGRFVLEDCHRLDLTDSLTDQRPVDFYRFDLPAGGLVVIRQKSAETDALVALFDGNRSQLLELDDNGGGGTDALIVRTLPAGSYQIAATTSGTTAATGDYSLQVIINTGSTLPASLDENKNLIITSADIHGVYYQGELERYENPSDPGGWYWRLASYSLATTQIPGVTLLPNLDLVFHPIAVQGQKYDAILERYQNPSEPDGLFWRLKSAVPRR